MAAAGALGGLIAGFMAAHVLQLRHDLAAANYTLLPSSRPGVNNAGSVVDRTRKSDRLDVIGLRERLDVIFVGRVGTGASAISPDQSRPALSWTHPATNMLTVPKGTASSRTGGPPKVDKSPPRKSLDMDQTPVPSPRHAACEPVASPIADPLLAQFSGRCVARLPAPAFTEATGIRIRPLARS